MFETYCWEQEPVTNKEKLSGLQIFTVLAAVLECSVRDLA